MPLKFIFIGIDYEQGYQACVVTLKDGKGVRFATGDVIRDWIEATAFAEKQQDRVMYLNSVDNFVHDNPDYQWSYDDKIMRNPKMNETITRTLTVGLVGTGHGSTDFAVTVVLNSYGEVDFEGLEEGEVVEVTIKRMKNSENV